MRVAARYQECFWQSVASWATDETPKLTIPIPFLQFIFIVLESRTAKVVVGSHSGDRIPIIHAGLPQSAVISPILYNIHVSDILSLVEKTRLT